jgi:hypothetical protein
VLRNCIRNLTEALFIDETCLNVVTLFAHTHDFNYLIKRLNDMFDSRGLTYGELIPLGPRICICRQCSEAAVAVSSAPLLLVSPTETAVAKHLLSTKEIMLVTQANPKPCDDNTAPKSKKRRRHRKKSKSLKKRQGQKIVKTVV